MEPFELVLTGFVLLAKALGFQLTEIVGFLVCLILHGYAVGELT